MYSCSYGIRNFVLLISFKSSIVCALGHIHVYCLGYALRMPIGGYCFLCIGCVLGNVASNCTLFVRCTTCGMGVYLILYLLSVLQEIL
jgi:hypothetical protein